MKEATLKIAMNILFIGIASTANAQFNCEKKLCKEMSSCEEACHQLKVCGYTQLDADKNGIPCESVCSSPCTTPETTPEPVTVPEPATDPEPVTVPEPVTDNTLEPTTNSEPVSQCTSTLHATYNPVTGEVYIPLIDVPNPSGETTTYEVYLLQQPLNFTFDLDTDRIVRK